MKKVISVTLIAVGLVAVASHSSAHHSFAAYFLEDQTTSVEGVVTEFWFANPHSRIYLNLTNEDGEVEEWMAEGGSRNVLTRRGWDENTIQPGMVIRVEGSPSRDDANEIGWRRLTTADGQPIRP